MTVEEISEKQFDNAVNGGKAIVDFYADWCMPCLMLAPVLEELAEKMEDIKFFRVNVDENQKLANKFKIMSIPCLVVMDDGEEVDRIIGNIEKEVLEKKIKDLVQ